AIREETIATHDEAIAARDSLTRAYARLRSELAQATSQLDLAISQLDEATYERDQAHAELVELRAQVEAGSGLQAPRPPAVSEVPLPSIIASSPSRRRQVDWVGRALAITLLLA